MIEFPPDIPEEKLLRKTVMWAVKNRHHIPTLNQIAKHRLNESLFEVAKAWQRAGFGELIEEYINGRHSVAFVLRDEALNYVNDLNQKIIVGRIKSFNRFDWIAFGALVVSIFALFKPGS